LLKLCLLSRPSKLLALWLGLLPLGLGIGAARLAAMPPPEPGMIEQYRKDGTLAKRVANAKALGNHRVDPDLMNSVMYRLRRMVTPKAEMDALMTPPSSWSGGLPATGNPKVLVLCIDFADYPHDETKNSTTLLQNRIFGTGDAYGGTAPYESLTNYYKRASYDQLNITGNVLGWYRSTLNRSAIPTTTAGRQALIKEALNYYNGSHDFAQYDNDGNGKIDYFAVIWTGPDTGWSEFWWAYQTNWSNSTDKFDGKSLGKYSWQWESRPTGQYYQPKTLIHETGHSLGLPDYYDYDDTVGPQGGVGGLDMMDSNWGDHNCFSKFLLGWITPSVYTTSATGVSLRAAGSYGDAAVFMPDATTGNTFGEFFMIQNRQKVQNDATHPGQGLLIWHVDSRLDPAAGNSDYLYDNSYTAHKLLRLMEADGLEQIEAGSGGSANAGDYYVAANTFGPTTVPNSTRYDGTQIWMGINSISAPGATMTFNVFTVTPDTTVPTGTPTAPVGSVDAATPDSPVFSWGIGTAADPDSGITGYYLQVGTTPGGSDVFDGMVGNVLTKSLSHLGADGQTYYARVRAMNGAALYTAWSGNSSGLAISYPTFSCASVDNCGLTFKTVVPWTDQSTVKYYGSSAAQSAAIGDNASSFLQTTVVGPGTLNFYWKASCETPQSATVFYDNLAVSIDGVIKKQIGGEVDWTQETYAIPAGSHVVRWTYTKDQNAIGGSDAGWVDKVEYTGSSVTAPTLTALGSDHGAPGATLVLTGTALTGASAVKFNGVSATSYTVNSDTQITVTVPTGATTGPISVITAGGSANSAATFTVLSFDLNKDAFVDLADLARLARYFGAVSTDAGFSADLDLNGDLVIDEKDVLLFFNGL